MKKVLKVLVPLLLTVGIIASIGWYLFVYDRDFTRDFLLQQARYHDSQGNVDMASWFYDLAYEHSDQDENVAIELANQYKADGNYTKAEYTLSNAIRDGGTLELYIALCKTYVEQDKLLDAVNMLDNISNPEIKAQLDAMRPAAPTADPAPGFYSKYIDVTIHSEDGTLYCTTDGEYPSTEHAPYRDPITLPAGETTIYALAVSDSGLVSPLAILGYTVGGVVEEVTFADPAVEAEVRKILGVNEHQILFTNDLWTITTFTVPKEAVTYTDLALMPYLQNLTLQEKKLDSLGYFSTLNRLESLDLTGCRFPVDDLSILSGLPELKYLTLAECGLSTIAGLENARNLTYLDLTSNTLRNLAPISNMISMQELYLGHNAVVDLSALKGLSVLEKLDVSYNSLTTLEPLAGSIRLTWLNASNNAIAELTGVDSLPSLTHLALASNQISDVTVLSKNTNLTELDISSNTITDISALSTLTSLDTFNFSYNAVTELPAWPQDCALRIINGSYNKLTSIDGLKGMELLSYVYMDYNELKNVDALAKCYRLVMVNVYGNEIKDVSALKYNADGEETGIIVNYTPM